MGLQFDWFTDHWWHFSLDDTNRFPVHPAWFLQHFCYCRLTSDLDRFPQRWETLSIAASLLKESGTLTCFDVKQPFHFHPGEIVVESRVLNHRSSLIRPILHYTNETSTSEGCLLGIGWHWLVSFKFLVFSAVFPTPLVAMRHAGLRSFKVPCFTTGATSGREMQAWSCDGRNLKSWPKVMAELAHLHLACFFFAKNRCCCMLL